jgi:hypothetical protein
MEKAASGEEAAFMVVDGGGEVVLSVRPRIGLLQYPALRARVEIAAVFGAAG